MKYFYRNMKCPSDMKLLGNEVKFAPCAAAHFIREAYFICDSIFHLAVRANFIEKEKPDAFASGFLFLERVTRLELATSTLARWRSTG